MTDHNGLNPPLHMIIRGEVGSRALGISVDDQSDVDEMGVFIEPVRHVLGLGTMEHYTYRTAPEGQRSGPGDVDLVLYGLKKFCRLAKNGNPTILTLLYLPSGAYSTLTPLGNDLRGLRGAFFSQEAGKRFLGYVRGQKAKMLGQRSPCVSRPELVERYGYDTKFAGHAVRLCLMGIEYMEMGRLTIPIREFQLIRNILDGKFKLQEVIDVLAGYESLLKSLVNKCDAQASTGVIERFMVDAYQQVWRAGGEV